MIHLQGENEIVRLRQIADKLAADISRFQNVTGVIFMGGLARGFMDKYSDIDIIALLDKENSFVRKQVKQASSEEQKNAAVDIDVEVHTLAAYTKKKWNEIDRWSFSKANVVFDPNGTVRRLLDEKLCISSELWIKRIAVCSEYLKWYCCPAIESAKSMAEAWIDRDDLSSAHYCLSYSLDTMLRLIFALNNEFVPPAKWKLFYSYSLQWLPTNYEKLLKEAMTIRAFSEDDCRRRISALKKLWSSILPEIEEKTGLNLEKLSKHYVEKVLRQS